jgi:hypothetical protein
MLNAATSYRMFRDLTGKSPVGGADAVQKSPGPSQSELYQVIERIDRDRVTGGKFLACPFPADASSATHSTRQQERQNSILS